MLTLDEFKNQAGNIDFQRTNMFSCVFATTPSAKSQQLLDQFGGMLFNNLPLDNDWLGLTQGEFTSGITSIITAGTQQLIRKSGVSKYLIGSVCICVNISSRIAFKVPCDILIIILLYANVDNTPTRYRHPSIIIVFNNNTNDKLTSDNINVI